MKDGLGILKDDSTRTLVSFALNPQGLRKNLYAISHPKVIDYLAKIDSGQIEDEISAEEGKTILEEMGLSSNNGFQANQEKLSLSELFKISSKIAQDSTKKDSERTRKKISIVASQDYNSPGNNLAEYDPRKINVEKTTPQMEKFASFLEDNLASEADQEFIKNIFGQQAITGFEHPHIQSLTEKTTISQLKKPKSDSLTGQKIVFTSYSNSHSEKIEEYLKSSQPEDNLNRDATQGLKRFLDSFLPDGLKIMLNQDKKIASLEAKSPYFLGTVDTDIPPIIAIITTQIDLAPDPSDNPNRVGHRKIDNISSVAAFKPNPVYQAYIKQKILSMSGDELTKFKEEEKKEMRELAKFLNIVAQDSPKSFFERIFGTRDKTQDFEEILLELVDKPQEKSFFQRVREFLDEGLRYSFPDYGKSPNIQKSETIQDFVDIYPKKPEEIGRKNANTISKNIKPSDGMTKKPNKQDAKRIV